MIILRLIVVLACIAFMSLVFKQVSRGRLLLKYSLLWLTLALVTILVSIFPEPVFVLARSLGFDTPSNFVFFVALFFLLAICLSLSVLISRQAQHVKTLVQELALLESQVSKLSSSGSDECSVYGEESVEKGPDWP